MSPLIGADTPRVDVIAERLHRYSQDVQELRTMAQRAVIEMRTAWGGGDFEHVAQRWQHEAGPRLAEAESSLTAMAVGLRAQSSAQRLVSRSLGALANARISGSPGISGNDGISGNPGSFGDTGGAAGSGDAQAPSDIGAGGDPWPLGGLSSGGGEQPSSGEADREASLFSVGGGNQNVQYELSLGKVEATADSMVDLDGHGNLVASAGVSAGAYLGYAAGGARAGNDVAQVSADSRAFVGAAAGARASGLIGVGGAAGHLGGEAFAGAKAVAGVSVTIAGASAAAGAEISYGIGAHADVDAALSAAKVGVAVDVGAALGLGAGVKLDVSVNPQEVMEAVANIEHVFAGE